MPGVQRAPMPAALPTECRDRPPHRSTARTWRSTLERASTADADAGGAVDLLPLQRRARSRGGRRARPRRPRGAVDRRARRPASTSTALVLGSDARRRDDAPRRGRQAPDVGRRRSPPRRQRGRRVRSTSKGSTKIELTVSGARKGTPFWLVLGESNNAGWEATVDGKDIGGSTLVDGYANGWLVEPPSGSFYVTLTLDAAAEGVDRARGLGGRAGAVPRARVAPAPRIRSTTSPTNRTTRYPRSRTRSSRRVTRPRVLVIVGGALAVGIVGACSRAGGSA